MDTCVKPLPIGRNTHTINETRSVGVSYSHAVIIVYHSITVHILVFDISGFHCSKLWCKRFGSNGFIGIRQRFPACHIIYFSLSEQPLGNISFHSIDVVPILVHPFVFLFRQFSLNPFILIKGDITTKRNYPVFIDTLVILDRSVKSFIFYNTDVSVRSRCVVSQEWRYRMFTLQQDVFTTFFKQVEYNRQIVIK